MKTINPAAFLLGAALLVTGAFADEPKNYKINVPNQARIGQAEVQPGEYKIIVDAPKVQMVHVKSGKTIDVNAKIETAEAKFDNTAVASTNVDGVRRIVEIRIGGSKTKLSFESN
jgi:hypothetical protein